MEMVPFRKLMDVPDFNSDIATDGDFPGDGTPAAESTKEEAGDDFGFHMAFLQPPNAAHWTKRPHTRRN